MASDSSDRPAPVLSGASGPGQGAGSAESGGEAPTGQGAAYVRPDSQRTPEAPAGASQGAQALGPEALGAWVTLGEAAAILGTWERTLRRRAEARGLEQLAGERAGRPVRLYPLEALRGLAGGPGQRPPDRTTSGPSGSVRSPGAGAESAQEAQGEAPDNHPDSPESVRPDSTGEPGGALVVAAELREQVRFLRRQLEAREVSLARLAEALANAQARQLAAPQGEAQPGGEGRPQPFPWLAAAALAVLAAVTTWAAIEARQARAAGAVMAAEALGFERQRSAALQASLDDRAEALGAALAEAERAAAEARQAGQESSQLQAQLSALRAALARQAWARTSRALPWPASAAAWALGHH